MGLGRYLAIVSVISLCSVGLSLVLGLLFPKRRLLKYIPAILVFFLTVSYLLFVTFSRDQLFLGLIYAIVLMIAVPSFILPLMAAIILEIIFRLRENRDDMQ